MFTFIKSILLILLSFNVSKTSDIPRDTNLEIIEYKIPKQKKKTIIFGTATWYGSNFHGRKTANGEIYNMHGISCATRDRNIPLGSKLRITNTATGKTIIVTVTDRMSKTGKHTIDLSVGAFIKLAPKKQGVIKIKIEKL